LKPALKTIPQSKELIMRKIRNAMIATAVLTMGIFGAGPIFAQDDAQQEGMEGNDMHGKMMEGGGMNGNMMGMMEQMNDMMEKCNAMMNNMQKKQEAASDS
jgi:hypothetical protein